MNFYSKVVLYGVLSLFLGFRATAQQPEEVVIPLSKPNQGGSLEVNLLFGSIRVVGTTGKEVVIKAIAGNPRTRERVGEEERGLRKITDNSLDLTITEQNNHVQVSNGAIPKAVNLEISVPQKFDVKVSSVNQGNLVISNVNGNLEVSNVNGNIILENVSGNALASTTNGNVKATFLQWDGKYPMAFSTLNGNVDVSLPVNAKFDVKLGSGRGEVYTDFEIARQNAQTVQAKRSETGVYKVQLTESVTGKVNGGGPEILMRNMNGNIYLRSAKK